MPRMHGQNDVVPEAKLILREFWGSKRSFVPQRGKIVRENSRRFRTLLSRRRPTQKWPRVYYCTLVFVLVTMGTGWAQSSSDQASTDGAQDMDAQPDSNQVSFLNRMRRIRMPDKTRHRPTFQNHDRVSFNLVFTQAEASTATPRVVWDRHRLHPSSILRAAVGC